MTTKAGMRPALTGLVAYAMAAVLAGCGGGGGESANTTFSTTVIDGALQHALVCLDKNGSGECDDGEPNGRTDAAGKVSFDVARADLGKYPVVAMVGTDAIDAEHGEVKTAFVLTAPADQTAVVSPLTTLVQQVIADTGSSTAEAAASVQTLTGLTVSVFADFTAATAPPEAGTDPATLARMLVVATQEQSKVIKDAVGTPDADGNTIKRNDLHKAIQNKLLERMPRLLTIITAPAVLNAGNQAEKSAAMLAAATDLATDASALTLAGVATVVAINNQLAAPPAVTAQVPSAVATLANLSFTDMMNFSARFFTSSVAQDTPDASNRVRYVDRRYSVAGGNLARWGTGSEPRRQADLNWNGTAWVACPINFEGTSTLRDAQGISTYTFCDNRETGQGSSAVFDIAGKTMQEVYATIVAAAFTNFSIANPATALGNAIFPADSKLRFSTSTVLTTNPTYYPAGKENPAGQSNAVFQFSPAFTNGGVASTQAPGTGCNATNEGDGTLSTSIESMVAAFTGNPCVYPAGNSFDYQGQTYTNPDPTNESWGAQSLSIGTVGTAPINFGPAPGFYTTNTRLRVAFKGTGTNPTVYLSCKERFNNGSTRNCTQIGTGTYTITTLGDARVMTFNNLPAQFGALTYNRVFVERGGAIYYGFQSKLGVYRNARLNTVAGTALLQQLGMPTVDPQVPLTLTAGSYQGVWDARTAGTSATTAGTTVRIAANGTATCQDAGQSANSCTVTITNPATGAFTATYGTSTVTGTLDFQTGTGSGSYNDPNDNPTSGNIVIFRR